MEWLKDYDRGKITMFVIFYQARNPKSRSRKKFHSSDKSFSKFSAIDPAGFIDEDGKHYVVYGGGHMTIAEVNPNTGLQVNEEWWPNGHTVLANGPNYVSQLAGQLQKGFKSILMLFPKL